MRALALLIVALPAVVLAAGPSVPAGLKKELAKYGDEQFLEASVAKDGAIVVRGTVALGSEVIELDAIAAKHGATNLASLSPLALEALVRIADGVTKDGFEHHLNDAVRMELDRKRSMDLVQFERDPSRAIKRLTAFTQRRMMATRIVFGARDYANSNKPSGDLIGERMQRDGVRAYEDACRDERLAVEASGLSPETIERYRNTMAPLDEKVLRALAD